MRKMTFYVDLHKVTFIWLGITYVTYSPNNQIAWTLARQLVQNNKNKICRFYISGTLARVSQVMFGFPSQRASYAKGVSMSSRHHTFGTFANLQCRHNHQCLQLIPDNNQMHFIYCNDINNGDIGESKWMPLNKNDSILIEFSLKHHLILHQEEVNFMQLMLIIFRTNKPTETLVLW